MFRGMNAINLDVKGRLALPTRYRDAIAKQYNNQLIVTIDTEQRCLLIYPLVTWEKIEQQLSTLPSFNAAARRIQRLLIGHATDLEVDGNGRILVPSALRDYAQLVKKLALIGQGNKFELWADEVWQSSRELWLTQQINQDDELPEDLQRLSL